MTIADIAHRLGLAESSTRYYRDRFSAFVPVVGEGRSRRYPPEALQVLATIAELSRAGTPAEAITERLRAEYPVNASAAPQPTAAAAAATQQQTAAEPQPTAPRPRPTGPMAADTQLKAQQDAERMRALLADLIRQAVRDETNELMAEVVALRDDVARLRAALSATQQQTAAADRNTPPVVDDLETPPMTDKPTFADPPAPVPAEPPPRPLGLLARVLVYELVAVVTWGVLAAGGAARFDPLGLPLLAVVVGVFAWLVGYEGKVRERKK